MAILNHGSTIRTADGGQSTTTIVTASNIGSYAVASNATYYIGTTQNVFNRASGAQTLTGVSIDGNAANITAYTINQNLGTSNSPSFAGATLSSTLAINGGDGLRVFRGASSTIASHIYWANAANTVAYNWQLDENNNAAMWGYTSAWGKLLTVTSAGAFTASGDVRAPIFYDSGNTSYYLDPANSGNSLLVAGSVGVGTTSTSQKLHVVGNIIVAPASSSWAEGLSFTMPTTSTWGGLRWRREVANADGNHYVGYTGLDSTDDLVFGSNNGGTQINNNIRITKAGLVGVGTIPTQKFHVSGIAYSDTDFRAPIFYDSNDTGYYVDPNSVSRLSSLRVYSAFDTASSDVYANMRVIRHTAYTDGLYIGYGNSGSGTTKLFGGGATTGELVKYSNYTLEPGSFRSPIFYDSDNTSYYCDPTSTSVLNIINTGTLQVNGSTNWTSTNVNSSGNKTLAYNVWQGGKKLNADEDFTNGTNGISLYNNSGGTALSITRTALSTAPNSSGYVLRVSYSTATSNGTSPGFGGFYFATSTRANAVFVTRFIANIPSGRNIAYHSNATGTNSSAYWLTNTAGTGRWEEYALIVMCGDSGTFSTTNYFAISGGSDVSFTWDVASATVFDITNKYESVSRVYTADQQMVAPVFYDKDNSSYYLDAANSGTSLLVAGNVGIGTTSASRKLIVNGDAAFATNSGGLVLASFDSDTGNIRPSVANGSILISDDSGALGRGTEFLNGGGVIIQSLSGFTPLEVKSNSSTLLFVASGGNVGIGTTSPSEKLDVTGRLKLNNSGCGWLYGNDTNHSIILRGNRDGTAIDESNYHQFGGTLASGKGHKFWTNGVLASQTLEMQIANDGVYIADNLGIGTTGPSQKLHVVGTGFASSDFRAPIFYDSDNTSYYLDPNSASNLNNVTVAGTLTLSNIAKNSTAPIVINSGQSASLGLRVYYDMNLYNTLVFTDSSWNSQGRIFGSSSVVTIQAATTTTSFVKYAGYSEEGGSFRAPIFYDSDNTSYYIDAAGTSSLNILNVASYIDVSTYIYLRNNLRMLNSGANGWLETIVRNSGNPYFQNGIDGGTFLASDTSENNNWLFQEAARGWGIFYFNRGTQSGQTFGNYTTVGAETFIIGQATGTTMPSGWTGYNASSKVAIMLSNYSGYIWANDTIFSATGMRAPIFYDSNDTNYYVDPASTSVMLYVRAANFHDSTGSYNVNLGSGNSEGRGLVAGYSGGSYGGIGYNVRHTTTGGSWIAPSTDTSTYLLFSNGIYFYYAAGGAAGRTLSYSTIGSLTSAGIFTVSGDVRAPIFYDSDNTGYYLNPAGLSQLSAVYANDWFRAQGNTGLYFQDKGYGITSAGAASNSYGNASTYGSGLNGWQGWGIGSRHCMMSTGGDNFGIHDNTRSWLYYWDGTYHNFQYGYLQSASSVRGPLFYDSDNTAYYCDPASTSNLNAITAAGNITAAQYYTGGWFRNSTSGNGLYNESTGQHFYSDSANYWNVASSAGAQGIRFRTGGHNGTVRGYVYANDSNDVGFLNSGGNWRARIVGGDYALFDGSSIRGQIFYDSNDTNYYCDPNGTSSFAAVNANAYYPHGGVTESDIYARSLSINAYHHGDSLTYDTFQFNAASTYETRATVGASFVSGTVETSIFKGDRFGGMTIANGVYQVRWTWNNTIGYKFFKTLYIANSTNGNSFTVTIESSANGSTWTTIATTGAMSNWPGHSWYNYFWNNNAYQGYIRLTITPSWSTANDINIYSMRYFCSYSLDAGSRLYDWDYSKNITFAANVSAPIFYDSNNTAYYIDPANSGTSLLVAGNVGIGTTSPTQKLDIVGSYGAADDNSGILKIRGPGVGPTQLNFGVSADGGYGWIQATNIAVDNDRDIILGPLGGNIGIGTTSPSQKLHIVGTGFASNDFRSPIFYDSNDTGYYLDPAGTSNLNKLSAFTMSYNDMNSMHVNSPYVARYNGSALYRNGTMGYGTTDCNVMFSNWGSGFIDSWGSPANAPGGSTHYVGLQGFHYNHQNNSQAYGFQMLCAGEADNRFFWRSAWPNLRSWVEMIHSGNIGSQTVATAGSCTGNAATATRTSGQSGYPHAGTGMWAFYNWGGSDGGTSAPSASTYTTGLSVGSNPGDQAYGFQIANNMWNTGLWTRNYNSGFGSWIRLLDSSNYVGYSAFTGNVDGTQFRDANNTAYYIDPASTSNLVGLTVANTITGAVSGNAGSVTINYNNDSNSTYQMLWGSGNNVYGTAGVYLNPSTDYVTATSFNASDWFRSSGATGWYNSTYGGGIYMTDTTWVRTYNSKYFYCDTIIQAGSDMRSPVYYDANDTAYYVDAASTSNLLLVKTRNTFGERVAVSATASTTINTQYNVTELTLAATITTLTLSNIQASGTVHMWTIVTVGGGVGYSITWPAAVKWPGGTAPTLTTTSNKRDIYQFVTYDGGTTIFAIIVGQNL